METPPTQTNNARQRPVILATGIIVLIVVVGVPLFYSLVIVPNRQESRLATCKKNMLGLLSVCRMYTDDYKEYPDKLSRLYPGYVSDIHTFFMHSSPSREFQSKVKADPTLIDTLGEYEYVQPPAKASDSFVVLRDKPDNHDNTGRHEGHADGTVTFVPNTPGR